MWMDYPELPISAFSLFYVALWANKLEVTVRRIIAMKVLLKSWLIEGKRKVATFWFYQKYVFAQKL